MQPTSVERDERHSMRAYKIIFYICAGIMILITAYALAESTREYLATGKVVIGEVLVNTEFPMKGSIKLVSYLMIVSVVGWFCIMKLGSKKTENTSQTVRSILRLVVLGIAVITFYEFIYNFVVWNALMTTDMLINNMIRIDMLKIEYPSTTTPWNLVFATKMFLAAFVISAHAFYVLSRPDIKVLSEQV